MQLRRRQRPAQSALPAPEARTSPHTASGSKTGHVTTFRRRRTRGATFPSPAAPITRTGPSPACTPTTTLFPRHTVATVRTVSPILPQCTCSRTMLPMHLTLKIALSTESLFRKGKWKSKKQLELHHNTNSASP